MKKLCIVLVAIMLVFAFAACQSSNDAAEEPATEEPAAEEPAAEEPAAEEPAAEDAEAPVAEDIQLPSGAVMSKGPHGEEASPASDLALSAEELQKVKDGGYKVALCFHYAGNDWSTAQQQGLKDQFGKMGIEVVSVTDANFKAEQQVSDIENAIAMKPDAIVSIPVDVVSSESTFKKAAAEGIKLVFMDNCPDNMEAGKDYTSVVSADNYGNGVAAAEVLGDALGGKGKIAMVYHDANFFVTNQRDEAFRTTIKDAYPDIEIVEEMGFDDENKGAEIGDALLTKYPDLNGIYATWDIPAEGVVSAINAANRDDVIVSTIDLGNNVAKIIAEDGVIKGLGAQRPYDQGVAEAILVGYALLGKDAPPYVALPALKVDHANVLEAYNEVYHVDAPADIADVYKQ
ncbi:MAG: substrate-binding domain-containing protein [Clostridiales Family XIII bacterium]|nr:substrate-binding domain-containing protein [Clostridiales Family XIII bacterium]